MTTIARRLGAVLCPLLLALALVGGSVATAPSAEAAVTVCNSYKSRYDLTISARKWERPYYQQSKLWGGYCANSIDYANIRAVMVPTGYHAISGGRCYRGGIWHYLTRWDAKTFNVQYGTFC